MKEKYQPYLRYVEYWLRSQEGSRKRDPVSFLLFALAIHPIEQRTGAEYDLIVHLWFANAEMRVEKIYQVKLALDIIAEYDALINSILKSAETKTFWANQDPRLLHSLANACNIYLRPAKDVLKILSVLISAGHHCYSKVIMLILKKMGAIDKFFALAAKIPDRRTGHRIHRVTTYACCMMRLIRLSPLRARLICGVTSIIGKPSGSGLFAPS